MFCCPGVYFRSAIRSCLTLLHQVIHQLQGLHIIFTINNNHIQKKAIRKLKQTSDNVLILEMMFF